MDLHEIMNFRVVDKDEFCSRETENLSTDELNRLTFPCLFYGQKGVSENKCLECEELMNRLACTEYIPKPEKIYKELF